MSDNKKTNNDKSSFALLMKGIRRGFGKFIKKMKGDSSFKIKVSVGVVLALVIIIVLIAVACSNNNVDDQDDGDWDQEESIDVDDEDNATDLDSEEGTADTDNTETEPASEAEQVNQLIEQYFDALANGDVDAIANMKSELGVEENLQIQKKSNYIENFVNLNVLSKDGPEESSYIAFVYYEIKFKDIETLAPGLTTLYICKNDAGELHIFDGELDEEVTNFIREAASEEEVVEVFQRVEVKYNEATDADATLKSFMESLAATLEAEVQADLAKISDEQAAIDAQTAEVNTEAEQANAEETAQTTEQVTAKETVNVRSSDSENADKLGKLDGGTTVTRYESKENGWSKIDYNGTQAYVKSEFLQVAGQASNTETPTETQTTPDSSNVQTVEGKVVVLETVNVRKSASENGERIGTAYQGEYYELVMKQADGWTKIKFNGQTGYVKSDFVK